MIDICYLSFFKSASFVKAAGAVILSYFTNPAQAFYKIVTIPDE